MYSNLSIENSYDYDHANEFFLYRSWLFELISAEAKLLNITYAFHCKSGNILTQYLIRRVKPPPERRGETRNRHIQLCYSLSCSQRSHTMSICPFSISGFTDLYRRTYKSSATKSTISSPLQHE